MLNPQRMLDRTPPHGASGAFPLALYRGLSTVVAPFAPLALSWRAAKGKEDGTRLHERRGKASLSRPMGKLIWIHGASVGESLAILPLTSSLLRKPNRHVLVTTGTVTSARLMEQRLPEGAFHQYVPIDSPGSVRRFLEHWQPDMALFVESELWPNLILEARGRGIPMALVNARLSERSFQGWKRAPGLARRLLCCFDACFAQDAAIAERLSALGAPWVRVTGTLKADAPLLPVDEDALSDFREALGERPIFLAASTHVGEEAIVLAAAATLKQTRLNALTVIVPRHPARGTEIETLAKEQGFRAVRRWSGALPAPDTEVYIADTMGELGLFYRVAPFAFMGGSLIEHGGQNPLEAAWLETAILAGPHTHNFEEAYRVLLKAQGEGRVHSADHLAAMVLALLVNPEAASRLAVKAKAAVPHLGGALIRTVRVLEALLAHEGA